MLRTLSFSLVAVALLGIVQPAPADQPKPSGGAGEPLPAGAALRLGTTKLRHQQYCNVASWSPDGKFLASGCRDAVLIWDASTGRLRHQVNWAQANPLSLVWSADGSRLGVGAALEAKGDPLNFEIRIFTVNRAEEVRRFRTATSPRWLESHLESIPPFALSPNGAEVVFRDREQIIRAWDLATGKELRKFVGPDAPARHLLWTHTGFVLASYRGQKEILVWDAATGAERRRIKLTSVGGHMNVSADGARLAVLVDPPVGTGLTVYSLSNGSAERSWGGFPPLSGRSPWKWQCGLAWSADQQQIIQISPGVIRRFDCRQHSQTITEFIAESEFDQISLSPDGSKLAIPEWHSIQLLAVGKPNEPRQGHSAPVSTIRFDKNDVVATGTPSEIVLWDAKNGRERSRVGSPAPSRTFWFNPDGSTIHRQTSNSVESIPLDTGVVADRRKMPEPAGVCGTISPTGRWSAEHPAPTRMMLRNNDAGRDVMEITESAPITAADFSQGDTFLAVGTATGAMRVIDVGTQRDVRRWTLNHEVRLAAVSSHGKQVAIVLGDPTRMNAPSGDVRVIEVATGRELHQFRLTGEITALAFSRDNKQLAVAAVDTTVLLFNIAP